MESPVNTLPAAKGKVQKGESTIKSKWCLHGAQERERERSGKVPLSYIQNDTKEFTYENFDDNGALWIVD